MAAARCGNRAPRPVRRRCGNAASVRNFIAAYDRAGYLIGGWERFHPSHPSGRSEDLEATPPGKPNQLFAL
ncbi:unnamed protein product, partial [Iphiclides podalirius]